MPPLKLCARFPELWRARRLSPVTRAAGGLAKMGTQWGTRGRRAAASELADERALHCSCNDSKITLKQNTVIRSTQGRRQSILLGGTTPTADVHVKLASGVYKSMGLSHSPNPHVSGRPCPFKRVRNYSLRMREI